MIKTFPRRHLLSAFGAAAGATMATGLLSACFARTSSGAVAVPDFRDERDSDDTAAFTRAIATGRPVHVPAGKGSGPLGEYLVGDVELRPGTTIYGDGIGRTVLRQPDLRTLGRGFLGCKAVFFCDSGSPTRQIENIEISDLTLLGYVREKGFAEHNHLLQVCGVRDVRIRRVGFTGFQGDGLILSASRAGEERHNTNIHISDCVFDGLINDNRNSVSVIDGDGILIERCNFSNCTRADMPGAIDFEPDQSSFAIIRNCTVRDCAFENIGGNVGVISFHIPAAVRAPVTRLNIIGNRFKNSRGKGFEIHISVGRVLPASAPDMAVLIAQNRGSGGHYVYSFASVKGLRAIGNEWTDYARGSHFGGLGARDFLRDGQVRDRFIRVGQVGGTAAAIFSVAGLSLDGSVFIDCGDGGPNAYAINFNRGRSQGVSLRGVVVQSPQGRTRRAVVKERTHILSPQTNLQAGNDFGGLPSDSIT